MYPVNKPNIYNQPKPGERFSLKKGRYFWYSSLMKTYNKAQHEHWQKQLEENLLNQEINKDVVDDNTN